MRILYIGDIMGELGMRTVERVLPELRRERQIDLVIAQAENVTDGKGMDPLDMNRLQKLGIDFFTGGNHTPRQSSLEPRLEDNASPVIGPANMTRCPGRGWKYLDTAQGKVLIVSLLGTTVGQPVEITNPLEAIDTILAENEGIRRVATVVNFHGDYSSEKVIIGHYLDGRASIVVGDHWHVPTADVRVLPGGTAHMSDVGMVGALEGSLGVTWESVIPRWRDGAQTRNVLIDEGPTQFNALLADIDVQTGLARSAEHVRMTFSA